MKAFDNNDFENYKQEVKEKWGETDAYKEYEAKHSSEDKSNDEALNDIFAEFAVYMKSDKTPDSAEAQKLVRNLQNHITENYYRCTNEILAYLGQIYVADERFKANINKHADGTTNFVCEAIKVYCK